MRCYNCGNVLSENDFCTSCGVDVDVYKKIVRISNSLYNNGLIKAQQRDLSGAADQLRRSIKLNKNNIKARNLLGLVYFEMGEVVQAMAEWVVSKNIKPDKNLADVYISTLQSNPNKLDTINQTIRKFNIALGYAKEGNEDLAIIQLKKVLSVNPNLIKGHQLLALLYMKREAYEKARKTLRKALKIDVNNPLCKTYLSEVERILGKNGSSILEDKKEEKEKEQLSGYDVIIPPGSYKESNHGTITVINVLIGIIIGVAATYFLITPAKVKTVNSEHNVEVRALNARLDEASADILDLEKQIDTLNGEKADVESQLVDANSANDAVLKSYDDVISAAEFYISGDYRKCAESISKIEADNLLSDTFNNMYNKLKEESYTQAAYISYNDSVNKFYNSFNVEGWTETVNGFKELFKYNYQAVNYVDAADKYCNAYIALYDTTKAGNAENPENITSAEKVKKAGIAAITKVIDELSAIEGMSEAQLDIYRNYLADLTSRE